MMLSRAKFDRFIHHTLGTHAQTTLVCNKYELQAILIAGAGTNITFDSIHKLIFATISIALLSYCAVSPRSVPFPEYNRLFLQNLSIVGLGTAIAPIVLFLGAFDGRYNNINTAVSQVLGGGWHNTFIFAAY